MVSRLIDYCLIIELIMSMIKMNEGRPKNNNFSMMYKHKPRKYYSDPFSYINEEDLTEDITDEGTHCSIVPNSEFCRKNMENSPLNRKGSPRKDELFNLNFRLKPNTSSGQSANIYQSDNCIPCISHLNDQNKTPNRGMGGNLGRKENIPYNKRAVQYSKKIRANSNENIDFKMHNQLLNLIPCEICREEEKEGVLLQKKSTIKEDIRQLLRIMAEANKNNKQNQPPKLDINEGDNNQSEIMITMKDVLSLSQANCDLY